MITVSLQLKNDHQREIALIFKRILPTNKIRKCIEVSLENLLVGLNATIIPLFPYFPGTIVFDILYIALFLMYKR